MEMNEMLVKAKKAKTPEELLAIANENGVELDEEGAKAYFEQLHQSTGELSDDELDDVSGGGCHKDKRLIVTVCHKCGHFECDCGGPHQEFGDKLKHGVCVACLRSAMCCHCKHCTYEKGLWLCNNPANMK